MAMSFHLPCLHLSISSLQRRPHLAFFLVDSSSSHVPKHLQCFASDHKHAALPAPRRSANYMPSIWDYDLVESLKSTYKDTIHVRHEELKEAVRHLLMTTFEPLDRLRLIDTVERLGLGYHFEEEIEGALKAQLSIINKEIEEDLYATALRFRLLRQRGYEVSQDVFNSYMDGRGSFKSCLCGDTKGILSLYEASHLSVQGETILDEAKAFTTRHLKCSKGKVGPHLERKVDHALELPLHWRMQRSEFRWAIDTYEGEEGNNPTILELARLDFNRVQAAHQSDIKRMSRWWRDLGLGEKLGFSRNRLTECFYWGLGLAAEPQLGYCREVLTKVTQIITVIDDLYDIYGTLDELELFTEAIDRWDVRALDRLPYYMKMLFLALYNTTNQVAYDILKEEDMDIIPYLSKVWTDLCKSMLVEAKWYKERYRPTLLEYLNNAWISSSGAVILVHGFFILKEKVTKEALECLVNDPNIIRGPAMIFRLCNDLATSKVEHERGDAPTSIQCYMRDANASEGAAREHVKGLIADTWKKMNEDLCGPHSPFPMPFINVAFNLARMAHCVYLYGDGHSVPDGDTKDRIVSLLVEPVPSTTGA